MARSQEPSRGLLDPVAKMLRLPFGTPDFIEKIVTGSVNQVGRRTLYVLITTWDAAGGGPFAASAIATTGLAKTAEIVQSMFIGPVFNPLLKMLGPTRLPSERRCAPLNSSVWASCATGCVLSRCTPCRWRCWSTPLARQCSATWSAISVADSQMSKS